MANWIRADIKRGKKKRSIQVFAHGGKLIVEKLLAYLLPDLLSPVFPLDKIIFNRAYQSFARVHPNIRSERETFSFTLVLFNVERLLESPSMIRETEGRRIVSRRDCFKGWLRKETSFEAEEKPGFPFFPPSSFVFHKPTHTHPRARIYKFTRISTDIRNIRRGRSVEERKFRVLARRQASL